MYLFTRAGDSESDWRKMVTQDHWPIAAPLSSLNLLPAKLTDEAETPQSKPHTPLFGHKQQADHLPMVNIDASLECRTWSKKLTVNHSDDVFKRPSIAICTHVTHVPVQIIQKKKQEWK